MKLLDLIAGCVKTLDLYDESGRLIESARTTKRAGQKTMELVQDLQELRKKALEEKE